jgi:hypothetical protein
MVKRVRPSRPILIFLCLLLLLLIPLFKVQGSRFGSSFFLSLLKNLQLVATFSLTC